MENIKNKEALQKMILEKEATLKQNESDRKEALEMNEKLTELINQMRAEIKARKLFSEDLEEKYFNLKNEVKLMKNESENSHGKISGEEDPPKNDKQEIVKTVHTPDPSQLNDTENTNLAVTGQVETSIKIEQQSTPSNSVLNYEHKDASPIKIQQSSTKEESSITNPTNVKNLSKVKHQNLSELIVRGSFDYCRLITKEIFQIIFSMIGNGMAWGILAIIFFNLTTANATMINDEGAMSLKQSEDLSNGAPMIIYGTAALITKSYIMNMSSVEQDLNESINNSMEAIAVQEKICKIKPISCPLSQRIIGNHKSSMQQSANSISTLHTICKNDKKVQKHLKINNPKIFSTIMGSSTSRTMITTAHSAALSHAHKLTKTEAPKRSKELSNKNNLWETPNEMSTRHSDQALQKHFLGAIESLIIQNSKNQSTQEVQQILSLAKDTAMAITTLVQRTHHQPTAPPDS